MLKEPKMDIQVVKDKVLSDAVRVEAIDYENEGVAYITLFIEPNAWIRAHEYVALLRKGAL
jgi:hypothetical protein